MIAQYCSSINNATEIRGKNLIMISCKKSQNYMKLDIKNPFLWMKKLLDLIYILKNSIFDVFFPFYYEKITRSNLSLSGCSRLTQNHLQYFGPINVEWKIRMAKNYSTYFRLWLDNFSFSIIRKKMDGGEAAGFHKNAGKILILKIIQKYLREYNPTIAQNYLTSLLLNWTVF